MSLTDLLPPGLSITDAIRLFYQVVEDTFAVNLAAGAASTWIAYDICLTFAEEVDLVWKAKWSLPKVMYFAVRYYGLAASLLYFLGTLPRHLAVYDAMDDPTSSQLKFFPTFWDVSHLLGFLTLWCHNRIAAVVIGRGMKRFLFGEGMFVLRLWASYRRNKKVLALIAFGFIAELTSSVTVGTIEARTISIMPRPSWFPRALPGCYTLASVPLRNTLGAWIVNCSVATIFFTLMLYKFITSESFRMELSNVQGNPLAKWFELRHFSPLLYLLLRDGVIYFAMIFFVNALNMALSIRMEGRALEGMGVAWTIAVSSVASSRLLLNLRGFIGGDHDDRTRSLKTTIRFEHPTAEASGASESGATGTAEVWIEMKEEGSSTAAPAEESCGHVALV
ncbi:hypothetical protein L226DRAFT_570375 [Lentinus tigrinus ALCF2SS1-7]|uniref:uncharacterized protein n=1 Tax=Lentinus tigrinus ALCF2SS1-7 TaxID=1328758 RepID=UPI0011662FA5|nr:hypothetical protein L226DRAFT_570375 [Lentinus tigrinus ALCF2SS1-7]